MDTSLTLHQIAPLIAAILDERRAWESLADRFESEGDSGAAVTARGKAGAVDRTLQRVIEAATGKEAA
jgi:hypothetical protein